MKKIVSILVTISILISAAPVFAEYDDEDIEMAAVSPWDDTNVISEAEPEEIIQNEVYYEAEVSEENDIYEPIVHTETLPDDIEISEEEFDLRGTKLFNPFEVSLFSNTYTFSDMWESMFAQQFGDDYLKPYEKKDGEQRISGNTNRLTIEETDLRLAGKNGLDVVIKRRHDNQDYEKAYSTVYKDSQVYTSQSKYLATFRNTNTNEKINVAFYTVDDFYTYMYNGCRLKNISTSQLKTHSNASTSFEFYNFSYIKTLMTDSTSYAYYVYDDSVARRTFIDTHSDASGYALESRKIFAGRNEIGYNWAFVMPEVFLYQYNRRITTHNTYTSYENDYIGAFRDMSGNVYYFNGWDDYKKYTNSGNENKYTSSFDCSDNGHLYITKEAVAGTLNDGTPYNFIVKDNSGYTYYFYDPKIGDLASLHSQQPLSIVAIEDEYGNRITYRYSNDKYTTVNEIIDTYGRHIYINGVDGKKVLSYYDDVEGEMKNITYETSTMPSSTLDNDSPIKPKQVMRLTVTNQLGEQTIYDARETQVIHACVSSVAQITDYPDIPFETINFSRGSNIERIIYPTGAETRYKYQCIYQENYEANVLNGVYAVVGSYDLIDGNEVNKKEYTFSNSGRNVTITETDQSVLSTTVRKYNSKGLMTSQNTSPINEYRPYRDITYTYTDNKPSQITVNNNGLFSTTKYSYNSGYPDVLLSETTDNKQISYSYYDIYGSYSNKLSKITYKEKSGKTYTTDYVISTELNDKHSVEYERITQNNIIKAQTKYEYDYEGNVTATKQWISDSNGDGSLDENDEYTTVAANYDDTTEKTQKVTTSVTDVLNADGTNEGDITNEYNINIYGSPMSYKDSYNTITTIEFDALNRPVQYNMPNGGTKTIEYDSTNNYTIVTDEAGIQYKNIYDKLGRIKEKQKKIGSNWSTLEKYTYDSAGRVIEKISGQKGASKIKETYAYDILNRITTRKVYENTYTLLYTETYTYGANSGSAWTLKHIDAADGTETADVKTYYDRYGNLIKTETISGDTTLTTQNEYDYLGRVTAATDARGNSTTYTYTYDGQVLTETDAANNTVTNQYDLAGRLIAVTDARGNTSNTEYDNAGRAVKVTSPFDGTLNAITKTYYDKNSQVVKTAVRKDTATYDIQEYRYDNMGNQTASITGTGTDKSVVKYEYDIANRLTKMTTGLSDENATGGSNTVYTYNAQGFLGTITDPMGQVEAYNDYDIYGNVDYVEDKNGNVLFYTYGAYGIKTEDSRIGAAKIYTYNKLGQITHTKSENKGGADVDEVFTYDTFGRMTSKTSSDGTVQSYTYDANSNILTYSEVQNDITKNSTTYQYDVLNRLTNLTDNDNIRGYSYDANSNLVSVTDASNDSNRILITYNRANLPTRYQTRHSSNNRTYNMSYYLNGNKYQETNSLDSVTKTYTYNSLGQLSSENETKNNAAVYSASYTYTPYGNRHQMSFTSGGTTEVTDYTYDANNRLTNEATSVSNDLKSAIRYYYDDNGNTTAEQRSTYTTTGTQKSNMSLSGHSGGSTLKLYEYDRFNRLIKYNDDGVEATYTYGTNNLRASKTVNGTKTTYVWNGQNLASETKNDATTVYAYDPTGVISAKTDNEIAVKYIKDPHGNVVATSKNKTLFGTYDYTAFGNQLEATDTTNPFRYCGEYYDEESGLTYLRNRYYNSNIGRFITEDPVKDGANWYMYCGGNPVNAWDPTGEIQEGDEKYGVNSKTYLALTILGEAWQVFPDYRHAIEAVANEVRYVTNVCGSSKIDSTISKGISTGLMSGLSTVEQVLSAGYPNDAMSINHARGLADEETKKNYNSEGDGTDVANAFKHVYWSAYSTKAIGEKKAKIFLWAHEFGWYEENLNNIEAMKMDLHNNALGREIAGYTNYHNLVSEVARQISIGKAAVVRDGRCEYSNPEWR